MNRSRLRDFIIRTVWPYLGPRAADASEAAQGEPASSSLPRRTTQQILFSSTAVGVAYIGRLDEVVNSLADAQLLYRTRGGEILRSFALNKLIEDDSTWTVEVIISLDGIRTVVSSFAPPVILTVDEETSFAEVYPGLVLPANAGIYARITEGPEVTPGLRIDGILEIERDAVL